MPDRRATIRAAYEHACRQEIDALKPGNVHRFADGHGMDTADFLTSASVSSGPITDPALPVGRRILEAVSATRAAVGMNTNLGILLLCAPIAVAAQAGAADLGAGIRTVLDSMTIYDAACAFEAIAIANPGGLGSAEENDVREPPKVGLLDAMRQAASRDRIAHQYASGYADIFELGLPALRAAIAEGARGMWPAIAAYLALLAAFPDSHVARKHGLATAEAVRREAQEFLSSLNNRTRRRDRLALLAAFDASLKQRAVNPGTTADLTVACLFVHRLTERLA